jgi:hypothetical protein
MKATFRVLFVFMALACTAFSDTDAESQFVAKLSEIISTKSATRLAEVFPETTSLDPQNVVIAQQLKMLMLRGNVEFQLADDEIVASLKERGGLTGIPMKLVICRPKQEIEGFEDATSFVIGESDGRLAILGKK